MLYLGLPRSYALISVLTIVPGQLRVILMPLLQTSVIVRAAPAISKPLINLDRLSQHLPGTLCLADRAVKSCSLEPHFICSKHALACQTTDSNVGMLLRCSLVDRYGNGTGASPQLYAHTRLLGNALVSVHRGRHLIFQSQGGSKVQTHEFALRRHDIFSIICGATEEDGVFEALATIEKLLGYCDVEYLAEELLLNLKNDGQGCTSMVARVSESSAGLPQPPASYAM